MRRFYDVNVDPDNEVKVTSGATEGLCATMLGILERGDEVFSLEPFYDTYPPVASIGLLIVHPSALMVTALFVACALKRPAWQQYRHPISGRTGEWEKNIFVFVFAKTTIPLKRGLYA